MATYILFWNPAISSYNMERFEYDFDNDKDVGNWSFNEHKKVKFGDSFYMVKCGKGKTGIVMQGNIYSSCYLGDDWSPKKRTAIYYADINPDIVINPETADELLTPEKLTEVIPDFNWYGGHSGRLLDTKNANILNKLWVEYIDNNPELFVKDAKCYDRDYYILEDRSVRAMLDKRYGPKCACCGYDYADYFDKTTLKKDKISVPFRLLANYKLPRSIYRICNNCMEVPKETLTSKLKAGSIS